MATLLPPPKRQKVYHGVPEPEPEAPKPSPHIIVQFVSEDDGQPLAPAVNLPANVSREGLEAIVNKLNTKVRFILISGACSWRDLCHGTLGKTRTEAGVLHLELTVVHVKDQQLHVRAIISYSFSLYLLTSKECAAGRTYELTLMCYEIGCNNAAPHTSCADCTLSCNTWFDGIGPISRMLMTETYAELIFRTTTLYLSHFTYPFQQMCKRQASRRE